VFDQIAGHGLFLVNIEDAAKVVSILTEYKRIALSHRRCQALIHDFFF
jgi:hypothetical protein